MSRYRTEQALLACSLSLIGAAVATRIVLLWLDRRVAAAVRLPRGAR